MLTNYIEAAMQHATYELLPESREVYGHIPGLDGVWATAESEEACRAELREVLEEWIALGLLHGHEFPRFGEAHIAFTKEAVA